MPEADNPPNNTPNEAERDDHFAFAFDWVEHTPTPECMIEGKHDHTRCGRIQGAPRTLEGEVRYSALHVPPELPEEEKIQVVAPETRSPVVEWEARTWHLGRAQWTEIRNVGLEYAMRLDSMTLDRDYHKLRGDRWLRRCSFVCIVLVLYVAVVIASHT